MPNNIATYVVEVDWDNSDLTAFDGEYDDISDRLVDMTWRIGRDVPNPIAGRSIPGTFTGTFKNNDGFFSRHNAYSPIYDLLNTSYQNKEINIRTSAPVALNQWNGFIEDIRVGSSVGQDQVAIITATGILTAMNRMESEAAVWHDSTADEVMGPDLAAVPFPPRTLLYAFDSEYSKINNKVNIEPCNTVMTRWYASDISLLEAVKQLESTEAGFIREGKDGSFTFRSRYHRFNATRSNTSQATWSDHEYSPLSFVAINPGNPTRNIYTKAVANIQYWTVQPLQVVYTLPYVPDIDLAASYIANPDFIQVRPLITDAGIDHIDDWGTPSATQVNVNMTANTQADGLGVDVSAFLSKTGPADEYAKRSLYAIQQIVDQTGPIYPLAYITLFEVSAIPVIKNALVRVEAGENLLNTYTISSPWLPSPEFALDYCNYVLAEYGVPRATLQVPVKANKSELELIEVLTRDLEDRVTIQANSFSGLGSKIGINGDYFIESMAHKVNRDMTHDVVYELSEVTTDNYWQLGVSTLGVETRLML